MNYRGFTYKLRPTRQQEEKFFQFAGVCRLVWNLALEQRKYWLYRYKRYTKKKYISYNAQAAELTQLRADFPYINAVSVTCEQKVLQALDDAWKNYKDKSKKDGIPHFKKRGDKQSFTFDGRNVKIVRLNRNYGRIKLPKIGWVKFFYSRDISGKITEVTVSLTESGWHVSVGCKECKVRDFAKEGVVGIDRGVSVPLMTSDGKAYSLPERMNVLERKKRRAQRIAARGQRGSNRNKKKLKRIAAISAKIARIRKHNNHVATTDICSKYGTVVIENLNTKNMTRSASGTKSEPGTNVSQKRGLNRSILNIGWFQIETMFAYKANMLIKVDPKFTSQTCSTCGAIDKRSRENQASFVCTACGFRLNADHNAAINILHRGNTPSVEPAGNCGVETRTASGIAGEDVNCAIGFTVGAIIFC